MFKKLNRDVENIKKDTTNFQRYKLQCTGYQKKYTGEINNRLDTTEESSSEHET